MEIEVESQIIPIQNLELLRSNVAARRGRTLVGAWAIAHEFVAQSLQMIAGSEPSAEHRPSGAQRRGNASIIAIRGVMSKWGGWSGDGSTIAARKALQAAVEDRETNTIVLLVESPGGAVAGSAELVDEVYAARQKKKVIAVVEDLGASAAYWVASQADEVYANRTAYLGSIGAYTVVADYTKLFEDFGIKVHMIKSGQHKGLGFPGTAVEDHHLAHWQALIDKSHASFVADVARGRNKSADTFAAVADGRILSAEEALSAGLIDGIRTLDEVLMSLPSKAVITAEVQKMSTIPEAAVAANASPASVAPAAPIASQPQAATLDELQAKFPKASSDWLVAQLKSKATLVQAQDAWTSHLEAQLEAANQKSQVAGNAPVGAAAPQVKQHGNGTFRAEVDARCAAILKAQPTMRPLEARAKAIKEVRAEQPQLLST